MSLMLKEIAEQPEVLRRTLDAEGEKVRRLGDFLRRRDVELIVLAARGSSDNASLFGRYLLEMTTGIPVSLCAPSVFTLYGKKLRLGRAVAIGVSQSGEGADINVVLERAKASGAFTMAITNEDNSPMTELADETLLIHAGRERSVAATKTFTGQMLYFYMLANALGDQRLAIEKLPDLAAEALRLEEKVVSLVQRYTFMENCVVTGRGLNYANAYELALKLMETCYVVAERFSSADFFHGPVALVERRFPVIHFAPSGPTAESSVGLLERLKELHADSLVITNVPSLVPLASQALELRSDIEEMLTPIPFIIPGQLFAAKLSEAKGLDPDAPRSLTKVTRTV
jgi:glutamine---fructose-6-phosphate transaminase (isomerizing)